MMRRTAIGRVWQAGDGVCALHPIRGGGRTPAARPRRSSGPRCGGGGENVDRSAPVAVRRRHLRTVGHSCEAWYMTKEAAMRLRALALVVLVLAASCAVPGGAVVTRYKLEGPRAISGPSPFAAGCPGARPDLTGIAGHELETAITVNPAN